MRLHRISPPAKALQVRHLRPIWTIPFKANISFLGAPLNYNFNYSYNWKVPESDLGKVGIDLKQEAFRYGQLYTAFTRATSGGNMGLGLVVPGNFKESRLIKSVVWRQVLQD
jgi:hypothetical protein